MPLEAGVKSRSQICGSFEVQSELEEDPRAAAASQKPADIKTNLVKQFREAAEMTEAPQEGVQVFQRRRCRSGLAVYSSKLRATLPLVRQDGSEDSDEGSRFLWMRLAW